MEVKKYINHTQKWLTRIRHSKALELVSLALTILLGLVFLAKGIHTLWYWGDSVAKMSEQHVPDGWIWEISITNVGLQVAIGLCLLASIRFDKLSPVSLGAGCSLLLIYTLYTRAVLSQWISDKPPCSCIGWLEGMGWSDLLRTNIILLLITTIIFVAFPNGERRPIATE